MFAERDIARFARNVWLWLYTQYDFRVDDARILLLTGEGLSHFYFRDFVLETFSH